LLGALADHASVLAAPSPGSAASTSGARLPETLDLMRALKTQFDPARVLNRRRFVGFI
jgi:FAD/FMN-containing dehydrogenase